VSRHQDSGTVVEQVAVGNAKRRKKQAGEEKEQGWRGEAKNRGGHCGGKYSRGGNGGKRGEKITK
jgi:hypothetical protein